MAVKNAPPFTFTVSVLEARVTATVGTGHESMRNAGQNGSAAANTFEQRFTQETGTH